MVKWVVNFFHSSLFPSLLVMDSQLCTASGEGTDHTSPTVAGHGNWTSADSVLSWVAAMRSNYGSSMTHDAEINPVDNTARVSWTIVDSSTFKVSERMAMNVIEL